MYITTDLNAARDQVLVDNTAQAIFKHLDRVEDNQAALGTRWIWELLQNARDAASPEGVRIQIFASGSELRFEHDGEPFSSKEIAHLVYHGSTKTETLEDIGQFGSGFLATHLLSRTVVVKGCLSDSGTFEFLLDRTGDSAEELRQAMQNSWSVFEQSVSTSSDAQVAKTSFTYEIVETRALELVRAGLKELLDSGVLVLTFCPEIKEIFVKTEDSVSKLTREGEKKNGLVTIRDESSDSVLNRSVAVSDIEDESSVALLLRDGETGLEIDSSHQTLAKLFVLFPLLGSERLGFPASVNSRSFKPREDRDGIVLVGDSIGTRENRKILEESLQHQAQILERCAHERWSGSEQILSFDVSQLPDWVGKDGWFLGQLKTLVLQSRDIALMPTISGCWIKPRNAWIPTCFESAQQDRLWQLLAKWRGSEERLPLYSALASWSRNLSNWIRLIGTSHEEMEEAFTIDKLAQRVALAGSTEELKRRLTSAEVLPWLISLLELLLDSGKKDLLDEYELLPNQAGFLCKRAALRYDESICEELKDIADALGMKVRESLLHEEAKLEGLSNLLAPETETETLDRLITHVKEICNEDTIEKKLVSWIFKLLQWIGNRPQYIDRLEGFPVASLNETEQGSNVIYLERGRDTVVQPLAPVRSWPPNAQKFGHLFPKRMILADSSASGDLELWQQLSDNGYLNSTPLIETERVMDVFLPSEPLPERDGIGSHKSTDKVNVSDIAFLVEQDIGLIDTARKSMRRARDLINFLLEFIVIQDDRAFEDCDVTCECEEEHKIYRGAWLIPLHNRRWVPLDSRGSRANTASAVSLARLLQDAPETASLLLGERGEQLLSALEISRADLAFRVVAGDESERLALIQSMKDLTEAAGDVERVHDLASEIREHPNIIDSIEEQKTRRQKIQRNQEIGALVENLLREELEATGLNVRRTGIGSDFEVENDFVESGKEIGIELIGAKHTTLIEVKSTKIDQVKMTPVQVECACSRGAGFALCVIPIDDESPTAELIRERLRVVFSVGDFLGQALADYSFVREAEQSARQSRGSVELEIIGGQTRFRISRSIWGEGLLFEEAIQRFSNAD